MKICVRILFVSMMNKPFIGLDSFLEHFPRVLQTVPQAKLLVVGGGLHLPHYKTQVERLHLDKKVIFTGQQPYTLVPQFISLASVCINTFEIEPATYYTVPGKDLEYLACAKPVVCRDQLGTQGIISEGNGIIFAKDDQEFVAVVAELLADDEQCEMLGRRGYEYVKTYHDLEKVAHDLEQIITNLSQN